MGQRIRLAEGLANSTLSEEDKKLALENEIVVKMAADLKRIANDKTKKVVKKDGRRTSRY